jgi:hypothetical protein
LKERDDKMSFVFNKNNIYNNNNNIYSKYDDETMIFLSPFTVQRKKERKEKSFTAQTRGCGSGGGGCKKSARPQTIITPEPLRLG